MVHSKTIGLIGIGNMGLEMAKRLLDAGYELIGYKRGSMEYFSELGGIPASSVAEVARLADIVILSLPDVQAVESVLMGKEGILAVAKPGTIVVETSTLPVAEKKRLAKLAKQSNVNFLDCPILGLPQMVAAATASFFSSGDAEIVKVAQPVLESIAPKTHYMGEVGTGSTMKMISNTLVAMHTLVAVEALEIAEKSGLSSDAFLNAVAGSGASSKMLEIRGQTIANKQYGEGGGIGYFSWILSDVERQLHDEAYLPLLRSATIELQKAAETDLARMDIEAMAQHLKRSFS